MAWPSSKDKQAKPQIVVLALVLIAIAAVVGMSYLDNPYYAVARAVVYAGLVVVVAAQLGTCLRLARGSDLGKRGHSE
jgi:hypothetical protein